MNQYLQKAVDKVKAHPRLTAIASTEVVAVGTETGQNIAAGVSNLFDAMLYNTANILGQHEATYDIFLSHNGLLNGISQYYSNINADTWLSLQLLSQHTDVNIIPNVFAIPLALIGIYALKDGYGYAHKHLFGEQKK